MHEVPVRMPKMSMTMTEGEVVNWLVEAGAEVSTGDTVCEVLTDKVDMEVESPVSGRLVRIEVESGMANVGDPIAWIETEDDDALAGLFDEPGSSAAGPGSAATTEPVPDAALPQVAAPQVAEQPREPEAPAAPTGQLAAVPKARALAVEHDIDLASLTGTGPEGRIVVDDVEAAIAPTTSPTPAAPPAAAPPAAAPPAAAPRAAAPVGPTQVPSKRRDAVRAVVARAMIASAAVPQFTVWRDLDLEAANAARGSISWTTVLLRGYAMALRQVPGLLGQWDGKVAQPGTDVNVALAVDSPDGLMVPTFGDPDLLSLEALDIDVRTTVAGARGGKVDAAHLIPATGSLSNLGGLGVDRFQALVTPPQASVLSLGTIDRRPVAIPGGLGLGLRVTAGLTVDHRVADGADGARLLKVMADLLADPMALLGPVSSSRGGR